MKPDPQPAEGRLLTGHRGGTRRAGSQKRGRALAGAERPKQARASKAAFRKLRELRRESPEANPWTLDAVARRDASRQKLAMALRRVDGSSERAVDVEGCGRARVLWDDTAAGWVYGEHGLSIARVQECGHRICVLCAPRASRRNRRNLLERVAHCDEVLEHARAKTLAEKAAIDVVDARRDEDAVARLYDGVEGGLWAAVEKRQGDGVLNTLFDGVAVDLGGIDLAAVVMRARVKKARRKVEKGQRQAIAREDAAAALDAVAKGSDARVIALQLHARLERLDAIVRGGVDAWTRGDEQRVHGPVVLLSRELARVPSQLERAAGGDPRAARSLELQDGAAWRRLRVATARGLREHALELLGDGRRFWRRIVGTFAGRVDFNTRTMAGADFVGHLVQRVRDEARKAAAHARLWRSSDVRFLTLTQSKDNDETAGEALERVRSSVTRFTRLAGWRDHAAGAIVKIEVERSTPTSRRAKALQLLDNAERLDAAGMSADAAAMRADGHGLLRRLKNERERGESASWWHAHAHIAVSCGFWDVNDIRSSWIRATRGDGSCGVDIQYPRRGVRGVLDELSKYITKPMGLSRLSVDEVAELAQAIAGKRLLRCTGALRGLQLEDLEHEVAKETTEGDLDKETAAGGCVGFVDDDTSALGRRAVYLDDTVDDDGNVVERRKGRWRDDDEAQEARRVRLERAHFNKLARRIRADAELPET